MGVPSLSHQLPVDVVVAVVETTAVVDVVREVVGVVVVVVI